MYTKCLNTSLKTTCFAMALAAVGMTAAADDSGKLADMISDDLAFAVAVPDGFRLENGDATLDVQYQAGATTLHETISLDVVLSTSFASAVDVEGDVYVGSLGQAAKRQFEQFQAAVADSKATGTEGRGGIAISVTGGCFAGAQLQELPISTWVQMDASQGYVEVIQDQNLFSLLDLSTRQRLMANLRSC